MNDHTDLCPYCGFDLDDGDIFDKVLTHNDFNKDVALERAKEFGWTEENKKRFSKKIGFYHLEKDRTTHYICPSCKEKIDE